VSASRKAKRATRTTRTSPAPANVPPRRPSATDLALDVGRHALPLVPLYLRRGSIPSYLVLTAFDLALGLMLIVGTTRDPKDPTTVDPRATWLAARLTAIVVLAAFFGFVATILTIPIGMPAFLFGLDTGVDWWVSVTEPSFVIAVLGMALAAGARAQHRFEIATTPGEIGTSPHAAPVVGDLTGDRRGSQAAYAAQVTLIATYVALSYLLSVFGGAGYYVFPIVFAAILVFYDARPDVAQQLLPELWRDAR
jgi:hypothetical protein